MPALISRNKQAVDPGPAPVVSIILPFEPKMSLKNELDYQLKRAGRQVEKALSETYPAIVYQPVMQRLQSILKTLNFDTHKKSIAIFVSAEVQKIYYLDIVVEEKIVVGSSFEIRDIILNKKQNVRYLMLLLSSKMSKMYLYDGHKLGLIKLNRSLCKAARHRDLPEPVSHYSDAQQENQILLDEFLHHMDEGLSIILKSYPYPLFILGPKKVLGHFKSLTHHAHSIIQYIHGNYNRYSEAQLGDVICPHVADWAQLKQQNILRQLQDAGDHQRLASGIQQASREVSHKNVKLLVVEENFIYPRSPLSGQPGRYTGRNVQNHFYVKDDVDDLIEKVLMAGGDIEFVHDGSLGNYNSIAAITRWKEEERIHTNGNLNLLNE